MKTTLPLTPIERKVIILGNLNIDLIIRGIATMPRWGQEIIGSSYSLVSSGQSTYTAMALARFNVPVGIIGNVGDDLYGEKIIHDLDQAGINVTDIEKTVNGSTGISVAIVRPDGERAFVSDPSCLSAFDKQYIARHTAGSDDATIACLVGLFFLPGLTVDDAGTILKDLQEQGKTTLLDTGWDPHNWQKDTVKTLRNNLKHVTIFMPNMDEARAITGREDPEKAAEDIMNDGVEIVVIKMGEDGCLALSQEGMDRLPSRATKVRDAVGAGDVFNAGFIYGTLQAWPIEARLVIGTITSSLYISRLSGRFPTLGEIQTVASTWSGNRFSFKNKEI